MWDRVHRATYNPKTHILHYWINEREAVVMTVKTTEEAKNKSSNKYNKDFVIERE